MGYLIVEMLVSLVAAFGIGFASAWLIQRVRSERRTQQLRDWVSEAEQVCARWEAALEKARYVLVDFDRAYRNTRGRPTESAPESATPGRTLDGKVVRLERLAEEQRLDSESISDWRQRYEYLGRRYTDAEDRVAELKARLARLRQDFSPARPIRAEDRLKLGTGMQEPADDLKRVSGIGPVFEQTLNEMGIRRFEQLAQLTEQDLERIAARLETVPYRIVRDRWVEQARELADRS